MDNGNKDLALRQHLEAKQKVQISLVKKLGYIADDIHVMDAETGKYVKIEIDDLADALLGTPHQELLDVDEALNESIQELRTLLASPIHGGVPRKGMVDYDPTRPN